MDFYTLENKHKSIYKTFTIYYICMVVFCLLRIISASGIIPATLGWDVIFSCILQIGVLFLLPLTLYSLMLKVKPKQVFKTCNFDKINIKVILISICLGILCLIINIAVSSLFSGILTYTGYRSYSGGSVNPEDVTFWNFLLDLFLVAVLPAFCEEFLHRGIVLQGTKHMGFKKSILLSSLLFGLVHFNINQVFYAFVIGLILGFVSVVAKNIWPAIIIHFVNNAISTYLDYASIKDWWLGDLFENLQNALSSNNSILVFIVCAIIMITVVGLLCLFIWLLYKQSIVRKVNKVIDKVYTSSQFIRENEQIEIEGNALIKDLLENNTLLNLDYHEMENPIDVVLPKEKKRYIVKKRDMIFFWGAFAMGIAITIFTYIWGLL